VPEAAYGVFGLVGVVGAVLGGLAASRIGARWGALPPLRWILLVESCALACLAVFHNVVAGGAALGVFIGATAVWNVLANSYQQQLVPRAMLGRVGAASRVVGLATAPIGAALGGLIADRLGVPAVAGFGVAVFALLTAVGWGAINRLGRRDSVSDAV
jgi:predicted MFS family arabinose efflux permease